jgi:hypothetical protein
MRGLLNPSRFRALTVALIACALAMRMLVPSGFMLTPAANGGLPTITICPGEGITTTAIPADMNADMPAGMHAEMDATGAPASHEDSSKHQNKAPDHPCAFAVASAAVDLAAVLHPVAPANVEAIARPPLHAYARPGLGLAAPPPPKTGPPILA